MPRPAAVALLLLLPAVAQADGGPPFPGYRTVWKDFIFTMEHEYPDYEFYLLSEGSGDFPAERLPLSPSSPVRVSGPGEPFRYKWANVWAVRKSALTQFAGSPPPRDWLRNSNGKEAMMLRLDGSDLDFRTVLLFTDTRERVEITCRVELGPDGGRLVKVAENEGNPWVRWGWIAAGVLVPVGLIGLGIWRIRRSRRVIPTA